MEGRSHGGEGAPRFDPVERLRHRFYEPLVLLSVLDSNRAPNPPYSSTNVLPGSFPSGWRNFSDGLAFLCDFANGGRTVCSVAGEATPAGTRFWLATSTHKAKGHLVWILMQLGQIQGLSPLSVELVTSSLLEGSILFSRRKVHNYARRLFASIERLSELRDTAASMETATPCTFTVMLA